MTQPDDTSPAADTVVVLSTVAYGSKKPPASPDSVICEPPPDLADTTSAKES